MSKASTFLNSALKAHACGALEEAKYFYQKTLAEDPQNSTANGWLGTIEAQHKNYDVAEFFLQKALTKEKNNHDFLLNYANLLYEKRQFNDAIKYYRKTIKQQPSNPICFANLAACLIGQNEPLLGLAAADESIKLKPDYAEAWNNRGNALQHLERFKEALASHERALELKPDYPEGWFNKGNVLQCLKRYEAAISHYDKSLSLRPDSAEAWSCKGVSLHELKHYEEAIAHYDKSLSLRPDSAEAWSSKGVTLHELKRYEEAIKHYDKGLILKPDSAEVWFLKGVTLHELNHFNEAITHYDRALILKPDYSEVWSSKAYSLNSLHRHSDSAQCYQKAMEFKVADSYLLGRFHHQMMLGCDWTNYPETTNKIFNLVHEGRKVTEPFGFQGIAISEILLQKCAEIYSNDNYPQLGHLSEFSNYKHHKIRIGYLCGEFRNQATSGLMTRVWELHNKSKFEIYAFDNGWDDGLDLRQRINTAFDKIFDISKTSNMEVARLIQDNEIDILINLNGFFGKARQEVFSYKPAPIQVNYLGFPGTIGVKYMDYIIADKIVIPEYSKSNYFENLVYLPYSYQANDDRKKISDRQFPRAQLGLPDDVFVFACFNNNYKINPNLFDSWMRILSFVPRSVLWLLADNQIAKENLIKEAVSRGIESSRLVFSERISIAEHLARHKCADLFLDTLPYNAHTTCSDALWAGLPVLTLMGNTFPGRVAASLLSAVGLSELITYTQEEYEMLAIDLATNPEKIANIKLKLAKNRLSTPLFDTPSFTKNLEAAYTKMYKRQLEHLPPECISIDVQLPVSQTAS